MSQVSTTWVRIVTNDIDGAVAFTETVVMWQNAADDSWWHSRYAQVTIDRAADGERMGSSFTAGHGANDHAEQLEWLRYTGWVELAADGDHTNEFGRRPIHPITSENMLARGRDWREKKEANAA